MAIEDYKELFATCASVCQVLQFLSGVLVVRKFMKKGSSNDVSPLPFICGYTSCSLWANYGSLIEDAALTLVNICGALLMFSYVVAHYFFSSRKGQILRQMLCAIIVMLLIFWYRKSLTDVEKTRTHLGIICCVFTLLFFASPLSNLAHVIKMKSSESLPFPMIVMSLVITALWATYGYILKDNFILYPNFLGFLLSCLQLSLFVIYPSR